MFLHQISLNLWSKSACVRVCMCVYNIQIPNVLLFQHPNTHVFCDKVNRYDDNNLEFDHTKLHYKIRQTNRVKTVTLLGRQYVIQYFMIYMCP